MKILGYVQLGESWGKEAGRILPYIKKDANGYLTVNEIGELWVCDCKEVNL